MSKGILASFLGGFVLEITDGGARVPCASLPRLSGRKPNKRDPPLIQEASCFVFLFITTYTKCMQFRVPQNITMEDRIVGPLSPIQFGIMVIGGGISFFVLQWQLLPSPVGPVLAGLLALFTIILAVGKFNDQPMYRFIKFIILFIAKPRIRVWHKETTPITLVKPNSSIPEEQRKHLPKNVSHKDIARLAQVLDSRGTTGVVPKIKPEEHPKP
jgi:hypothetical protein